MSTDITKPVNFMPNTASYEETIMKAENGLSPDDDDTRDIIPANDFKTLAEAEKSQSFLSEKQLRSHVQAIREVIRNEEKRLRTEYPFLQYQNFLGMTVFVVSWLVCFVNAYLYLKGYYSFWLAIPIMGLAISFLHELEHDLIHNLYFKGNQFVQHFMFFTIWMSKLSGNPWYRKVLHLRHHILSGQLEDLEERFIGLGKSFGWMRWIICVYPFSNTLAFPKLRKDNKSLFGFDMWILVFIMNTPGIVLFTALLHLYLGYVRLVYGLTFGSWDPVLTYPMWAWPYVRDMAVLWILPNLIRQAGLNLMASYCHYYGDIPKHNVYYQNQVLNHWIFYPFQLFCFNFGETHLIHHFVSNQTFYLRQMLAPKAIEALVKHGVRHNDLGTVRRANRYFDNEEEIKKDA